MDFTGKVILITGAANGIGADTARYMSKLGGRISMVDIDLVGLNDTAKQLKLDNSPTPLLVHADTRTDAERIINETVAHFGQLDVLVHSAATGTSQPFMDTSTEWYDDTMNTNLQSVVVLTKLAVPHLEKTKGNIINVSSMCGMVPGKFVIYALAKAALDQFTKCAAVELGPRNIRVNSVNPSLITTHLDEKSFAAETLNRIRENCKTNYPIGRMGEVTEVAATIAFLASDLASFITGSALAVDGGAIPAGAFDMFSE